MPDMMFILILALLLFGPKKVPEIARKIAQFRNLGNELKSKLEAEFQQLEAETQNLVPSSVADFKETIQPLTQIREELETAISLDSDPQEKPPQTNPTASEKSSTTP
ncbi:MAG: twin-arginine translocase TatA/TatE family subunit [Candidatus Korobacteraceae bacterium]